MNWKNPKKELPKADEIVWVVYGHWKEHNPMSYEMMAGEVEISNNGKSIFVCSGDFTGKGSWGVYLKYDEDYSEPDEVGLAWISAKDFKLPEWTPHDEHWGKKK